MTDPSFPKKIPNEVVSQFSVGNNEKKTRQLLDQSLHSEVSIEIAIYRKSKFETAAKIINAFF